MGVKTLTELRLSVRSLYGDYEGVTAVDAEVDMYLKDGINRILDRCPWMLISNPELVTAAVLNASGSVRLDSQFIAQMQLVEVPSLFRTKA